MAVIARCFCQVGQIPILDSLFKILVLRSLDKSKILSFTFLVVKSAKSCMDERLKELEYIKSRGEDAKCALINRRADLLSMFLKAKEERPNFFHDGRVLTMAVSIAFAGSDTTAISLSAVFYYLIENSRCYQKLMDELDTAVCSGVLEDYPTSLVSWAESQKLPYLNACVKEAFRLHPAAGLPLESIVPPQGAELCGEFIAGGTIVGSSAWVIIDGRRLLDQTRYLSTGEMARDYLGN